jgi:glycosyltransferase involved in cell wall biosynthesis
MAERIAVITMGVKLGNEEKGYTRFLSLSRELAAAGFEVELITSAFQHWEKTHRNTTEAALHDYPFKVSFINEPGYRRNIAPARLISHRIAAKNLATHLRDNAPYSLVYCEIPPNDVARKASEYARGCGIPFIVDVNDLWPEAMRMVLDLPVISTALFAPLARDARVAYQNATAIVGTSDEYALHPFRYRPDNIEHLTVYVGNELAQFDAYARENSLGRHRLNHCAPSSGQFAPAPSVRTPPLPQVVSSSARTDLGRQSSGLSSGEAAEQRVSPWTQIDSESGAQAFIGASLAVEKPAGEFWVTYAGTLGTSYDIATMLRASEELQRRGYSTIRVLIIGGGPHQAQLEELAQTLAGNTSFVGYLDYPQMAAYLSHSDVLVNSLVKKAPQSIVNKIADYVAAGKPMINTGESPELKALVETADIGVNIQAEDPQALADAIATLFEDPERRKAMGHNARSLAIERFDRATSYQQIVNLITRQIRKETI